MISASVAVALILVPTVAITVVVVPDWSEKVLPFFMMTLLPGYMVAMFVGGNVHDFSRTLVCVSAFLFWFALTYGIVSMVDLRTRRQLNR